jgi:subfamily B ATP-binding cassette protein HlyB/CyaB
MNAGVLCFGAWLAMNGETLTIGMLVAFQMFAGRVTQPLLRLAGLWQQLQEVRIAVAQLGDVMNTPTEDYSPMATSLSAPLGALSVERLAFRYRPDLPPVYENLSFELKPGEVALITGPSGSGKSTLAKVIQGFYPAAEGVVRLDGRDIRTYTVNELRSRLGVVPQESVLFAGTVLDNLQAIAPHAPLEHVHNACKLAGVHEVIESLPKGYQTELGERGIGLSGGQKQRLAIARALLKRPKVLILDEAVSGLDDESAELVAQTVNQLKGIVTVLFVTHKVPTGLKVDRHLAL